MSRTLITTARPITMRARPNRFVAAGLAAFIAAGGGASGATPTPVVVQVFGDPTVHKGAGGR